MSAFQGFSISRPCLQGRSTEILTAAVGDMPASEAVALGSVEQAWEFQQHRRREEIAAQGGEQVEGGRHGLPQSVGGEAVERGG